METPEEVRFLFSEVKSVNYNPVCVCVHVLGNIWSRQVDARRLLLLLFLLIFSDRVSHRARSALIAVQCAPGIRLSLLGAL